MSSSTRHHDDRGPTVGANAFARLSIILVAAFLVAACTPSQRPIKVAETKLHFQSTAKYERSADGGTQQVWDKEDEVVDLTKKAIVVMRGELVAPPNYEYKAISINYRTQPVSELGSGRDSSSNDIEYLSDTNHFHAVLVEPGTYRYAWNALGSPAWVISRYSPSRLIEFTVAAGEAVYVGDLRVIVPGTTFQSGGETVTGKFLNLGGNFYDYDFLVEHDDAAAQRFYNSLPLDERPPLQSRIMTNNPMPNIRRYGNSSCDGRWRIAYASRGIC